MQKEFHVDNRGMQWRIVQKAIGEVSNAMHIGHETLYAYLFQSALAFVQKRIVAGCNVVMIVAQFGDYDNADNVLQAGRGVMCWMVVYTDGNTPSPHTVCLYSHTAKDANSATEWFDNMVATLEKEVEV